MQRPLENINQSDVAANCAAQGVNRASIIAVIAQIGNMRTRKPSCPWLILNEAIFKKGPKKS